MDKFSLSLPSMYADHHVVEVRRILLALPGLQDIYASSGFRIVEAIYDPDVVDEDAICSALQEAGYLEELPVPVEVHPAPSDADADRPFFRRTADFPNLSESVSFTQAVPAAERPLWPCPGLPQTQIEKEVDHG